MHLLCLFGLCYGCAQIIYYWYTFSINVRPLELAVISSSEINLRWLEFDLLDIWLNQLLDSGITGFYSSSKSQRFLACLISEWIKLYNRRYLSVVQLGLWAGRKELLERVSPIWTTYLVYRGRLTPLLLGEDPCSTKEN